GRTGQGGATRDAPPGTRHRPRLRMSPFGPHFGGASSNLWMISCPLASETVIATDSGFENPSGTSQVTFPSGETATPSAPKSSLNFPPPFFDSASIAYSNFLPGATADGCDVMNR